MSAKDAKDPTPALPQRTGEGEGADVPSVLGEGKAERGRIWEGQGPARRDAAGDEDDG